MIRLILIIYLATVVFSYGALKADMVAFNDTLTFVGKTEYEFRRDSFACLAFSFVPVVNVPFAVIVTAGCYHGFCFKFWRQ